MIAFAIGLEHMATQWLTVFEEYGQHQPLNRQAERATCARVNLPIRSRRPHWKR